VPWVFSFSSSAAGISDKIVKTPSQRPSSWQHAAALGIAALCLALPASAHHGFDANGTVRLLDKQCLVIVRMSPPVVAALLGPGTWNGTVAEGDRARLTALAKRLFVLRDGPSTLEPKTIKVAHEVSGDVAFVLSYPAVTSWPFTLEAGFSKQLGPELTGSVRFYSPPSAPTDRQGKQIGLLDLTRPERTLTLPAP
jgi:hypothetical protein